MRRSSSFLVLVLLLIPFLAGAAAAAEPVTSPAPEPAGTTADCRPADTPQVASAASALPVGFCGTCSTAFCRDKAIGTACGTGGRVCQPALGNTCSTSPLIWQCQCWSGPLP